MAATEAIQQVRRFNRAVTQQIGALDSHYLGRNRSLGASRLLFEIGADGIEVRQLRSRLGLDSGYTSRLLRGLEAEGLVRTGASQGDARVRLARLTAAGRQELALLNRLSDEAAEALLDRLTERQRADITAAMGVVARLLRAAAVSFEEVDPRSPPARYSLERYFEELSRRFETGFDPKRSPTFAADFTPPRGLFVVATLYGDPIACGGLKLLRGCAEVKRMWVAPSSRGLGLGRRLLAHLEHLARRHRRPRIRLETNKALVEAQALYRSSGYREVAPFNDEPYAHHWFEKGL